MPKLNQIIAIQAGKKAHAKDALTVAYHAIQKPDLLTGIARSYKPKDEGGEMQPPENKLVQVKVKELIGSVERELIEMFDVVATQESSSRHTYRSMPVQVRSPALGSDVFAGVA